MKPGASSLNAFAESYVPLIKRGVGHHVNNEATPGQELNRGNEVFWVGHQPLQDNNSLPHGGEVFEPKDTTHVDQYFASTSQYPNAAATHTSFDEEFDMDLAYLQMQFPELADECLFHVYDANRHDLHATIDMLNQLEIYPDDLVDRLPDTLDIGDVSESVSSQGVNNSTTAETGASTSGSTNTPSAG